MGLRTSQPRKGASRNQPLLNFRVWCFVFLNHPPIPQPVDVADAIDFEDCFQLAEHIAEHGNAELGEWCANRRLDVVDAMNEIAVLDDISRTARSPMSFSLKRMYYTFSKTFSRSYKRALRPYS